MAKYHIQLILVLLISLICLGRLEFRRIDYNSDKELQPYVKEFIKYANLYWKDCWENREIHIELGDIQNIYPDVSTRVIGICNMLSKRIIIDIDFFNYANEYEREEVIFHELGHCYLDRPHIKTRISNRPTSIMYPTLLDYRSYKQYRQNYIYELFTNATCN